MNQEEDLFQEFKMETKNENINRQTAFIVSISEITQSKYIKTEGEWTPNYLEINSLKVSRINLMGVVISVSDNENLKSFVLDDGTGSIQTRVFDENFNTKIEIGDIIMIVGKIREYNDEKYIVPEIIKIMNEDWLEFRKKQLNKFNKNLKKYEENNLKQEEIVSNEKNSNDIFKLIKDLDKGEGVYIEEIFKINPNAEQIIKILLNEGEIFEIKPGKYKVLE